MDVSELSDPLRVELNKELHGRPAFSLRAPARISHFAFLSGEGNRHEDRQHLQALCSHFDVDGPAAEDRHFMADLGSFFLKWERHTEFTTYTVAVQGHQGEPFASAAAEALPQEWFRDIPGRMLVALNIELVDIGDDVAKEACFAPFWHKDLAGSKVAGDRTSVWSDFRIHDDHFMRMAVLADGLSDGRLGRLAQRIIEIVTYGHMALMALPVARGVMASSSDIEATLEATVSAMAEEGGSVSAKEHLDALLKLSARAEHMVAQTSFRFSAAKAYHSLVERRFEEVREERVPGNQRLSNLLDRQLAPAMRTCEAAASRLSDLSSRIDRAAGLLRTQVDLESQSQNKALMVSMNQRAKLQLRLQETVEGLSVVAISYYAIGIVSTEIKALKASGFPIDVGVATGISAPVIIVCAYLLIRRIRKSVVKATTASEEN